MAFVVQAGGNLADYLRRNEILSTTKVRKLCNSTGFIAQAIALVVVGYTGDWKLVVVFLTVSVGLNGFVYSGFFVNHLDIAPQYAGVLIGISNTIATLPGIFSPLLTGIIVQHHTAGEWRVVFYIGAVVYALGAIFYIMFGSGNVQIWASETNGYEEVLLESKGQENNDDEEQELSR
ncbi:hypothetical protein QZH41_000980 [Actinostola sp. cb2023]|nr:hypothetical protein QZH41_000980 [Actinostola sp. cb2023]